MSTIIIDNPNYRVVTGAPDPDDPDYNDWADKFLDLYRPKPPDDWMDDDE